jgi:hypothetical protein
MLELIGSIALVYYLVLGLALLIFLTWSYIDDRMYGNRRRRAVRTGKDSHALPVREAEPDPGRQANQHGRRPDNVVRFRRRN